MDSQATPTMSCVDRMAGVPSAVLDLLHQAWEPAKAFAENDRQALTEMALTLGQPTPIAAWDWRYLAQKVRAQRFDLDDAELKPYFSLNNMLAAMFDCAQRLFGLQFVEQSGVPLHHPDARLWEVRDRSDALIGLFIGDNFARTYQTQRRMDECVPQPVGPRWRRSAHRHQQQ